MSHRGRSFPSDDNRGSSILDSHPDGGPDQTLIERRFCAGDEEGVALVWTEYGRSFVRRLRKKYWWVLSRDRCEELALLAVERAWEHRAEFDRAKGCLEAWLWCITCRRAADLA